MTPASVLKAMLATSLLCVLSATAAPDPAALNERFFRVTITANAKPLLAEAMFEDPDGRFIMKGASLASLIGRAYGVQAYQVVDAPQWVYRSHVYDIEAEPPPAELVASDDARMLRTLLADRFGLQVHGDKRELTMLVLDKDAERQRELAGEVDCGDDPRRNAPARGVVAPGGNLRIQTMRFAPCISPQVLVSGLARQIGEPIHVLATNDTLLIGAPVRLMPDRNEDPLALAAASLAQSGILLERRTVEIDVLVVTAVEHPQLSTVDH